MRPLRKTSLHFFRKGFFITNNHTPTQCTVEGWKGYMYKVTMIANPKLDESGFLIDHNKIHALVCDHIEKEPMYSCELMVQKLCEVVYGLLDDYGVDLQKLCFELVPVDHLLLQPNESGELVPNESAKQVLQAKPAAAVYWMEFE